jgi:hypothetical protein
MFKPLLLSTAAALSFLAITLTPSAATNWSALESKSPEDGSAQIGGASWSVMRRSSCVAESKKPRRHIRPKAPIWRRCGDGQDPKINSDEPRKEVWRSSANSFAAFVPKAEEFVPTLPEAGRVYIRALTPAGGNKDTNFVLSGVSEVREKIARACNWSPRRMTRLGRSVQCRNVSWLGRKCGSKARS